jgi:hypothetical protein
MALINGNIYTVNSEQPWAEAVAIKDGHFLAVGSSADIEALTDAGTKVIDLDKKFVMPGTVDLHTHPFITPWYGDMNLSLKNPDNPEKILEEIKAYAEANPDKEWILAGQWHVGIFPDDAPTKEMLDGVVSDRPVAVLDQTGHTGIDFLSLRILVRNLNLKPSARQKKCEITGPSKSLGFYK